MDDQTLRAIQNMTPSQAKAYLERQEERAARKAESLADLSIEQLQARRDKIPPRNQAERQPYHDELSRRLLGESQNIAASRVREWVKGKLRSGSPLSWHELKVRAHDWAYSGDVKKAVDEAQDELLEEQAVSGMTPEQQALYQQIKKEAEGEEGEDE